MSKYPCATESVEQQALFRWAEFQSATYPELKLLFHIPNGGKRNIKTAKRLKCEGVKAGVPDLFLPVARGKYNGLFIELKRERGNKATEHQIEWLANLQKQGYAVAICYGWEAAANIIFAYLGIKGNIKERKFVAQSQYEKIINNSCDEMADWLSEILGSADIVCRYCENRDCTNTVNCKNAIKKYLKCKVS